MSELPGATLTLDPGQEAAAHVSADVRQIVLAGPGTGKTEVVASLIQHLIDVEDLSATDEILVISFSRAAVEAVRKRVHRPGRARVTVRTLDALASRLLADLDESEGWENLSFDKRIERALGLLRASAWDELEFLRHLVVDEVQDIVGVRAELLLALIGRLPEGCGFTLLGDPMQALYDFQRDAIWPRSSSELVLELASDERVREHRLEGQYRAKSLEAEEMLALGFVLNGLEPAQQIHTLDEVIAALADAGGPEGVARVVPRWSGSTVLLCRTNGEALVLLELLRSHGLPVQLQRSALHPVAHPAIAQIFAGAPGGRLSRPQLVDEATRHQADEPARFAAALADLTRARGDAIEGVAVARALMSGMVPLDLQPRPQDVPVVSTIHRAKGLEFDNVVLVGATQWLAQPDVGEDALRSTFVALTRTRNRIANSSGPDWRGLRLDKASKRWIRGGPQHFMTFGFEMQGQDTRSPIPEAQDATLVQSHLAAEVQPGDPVELVLDPLRSTLEVPVYSIHHNGMRVGTTSRAFGECFVRRIRPAGQRKIPWPRLTGGIAEGVETVAGAPQTDPGLDGVGRWGLWLSIRVAGMLSLDWGGSS